LDRDLRGALGFDTLTELGEEHCEIPGLSDDTL
jgi:hypothetical protein